MLVGADDENLGTDAVAAHSDGSGSARGALLEAGTGHGRAVGIQLLVVDMLVGADDENLGADGVVARGDSQGSARSTLTEAGCGDAVGIKQLVVDLLIGADNEGFRRICRDCQSGGASC